MPPHAIDPLHLSPAPHLALSTPPSDERVSLVDHEHKHDTEGFKRIPRANFSSTEYQLRAFGTCADTPESCKPTPTCLFNSLVTNCYLLNLTFDLWTSPAIGRSLRQPVCFKCHGSQLDQITAKQHTASSSLPNSGGSSSEKVFIAIVFCYRFTFCPDDKPKGGNTAGSCRDTEIFF